MVQEERRGDEITLVKNLYVVQFPDGSVAEYGYDASGGGGPDLDAVGDNVLTNFPDARVVKGRDLARGGDGYYCRKLTDRWGNSLRFEYTRVSYRERVTGALREQLLPDTITEVRAGGSEGRWVSFVSEQPAESRPYRLAAVELHDPERVPSLFLRYALGYLDIDRVHLPDYGGYGVVAHPLSYDGEAFTDTGYFLSGVEVDGLAVGYQMRYSLCGQPGLLGGTCDFTGIGGPAIDSEDAFQPDGSDFTRRYQVGTLRELELPTGATIRYDYGGYSFLHLRAPAGVATNCDFPTCGGGGPESDCQESEGHRSLGVTSREVGDGDGGQLELTTYLQGNDHAACVPLRVDLWGGETCPFDVHSPADVASVTTTTVTRHGVADGVDAGGALATRDDRSVYTFSLGTAARDEDHDGRYTSGDRAVFALFGAMVKEEHYRGDAASPVRTVVHSYTSDDGGLQSCGPVADYGFDTPVERSLSQQRRASVTYDHDDDTAVVSDSAYETDGCLPSACGGLFATNVTRERAQDVAWATPYNAGTPFAPLAGTVFDRTAETSYWHDGLAADLWLVGRPESQRLREGGEGGALFSETSFAYGQPAGAPGAVRALVSTRVHAAPGTTTDDDVVTAYDYAVDPADSGYGKPRVIQVGFAAGMGAPGWAERSADDTSYLAYDHGVAAAAWKVCLDQQSDPDHCPGWSTPADEDGPDFPAELQVSRSIRSDLRLPSSSVDASLDGLALVDYDAIGRVTLLRPTGPDGEPPYFAETGFAYPSTTHTEVSVGGTLVASYDYDALGRLEHVEQILPNPDAPAAPLFRHKTFRRDGVGQVWRESDWLPVECSGSPGDDPSCAASYASSRTLTPRFDPFGRAERVEGSDGSVTTASYSGVSRVESTLADLGATALRHTVTDLDARGNPRVVAEDRVVGGPAVESAYAYDLADRLTQVTVSGEHGGAPVSQARSFAFDARGFATGEMSPEGGTVAHSAWSATGMPLVSAHQPGGETYRPRSTRPDDRWRRGRGSGRARTSARPEISVITSAGACKRRAGTRLEL